MQIRLILVLLGFIVMMFALVGCSSSNSLTGSANATIVSFVTETPSGAIVPNPLLTFFFNGSGTSVGQQNLGATGVGSYGLSPGVYTIEVTGPLPSEETFLGTYTVGSSAQTLNIVTPTAFNQLPGNITGPPGDSSATLVIQAVNTNGVPMNQPFSATVGTLSGTSTTNVSNGSSYVVIPEVSTTTGITTVAVNPTSGSAVTVNNLTFTAGNVVLLDVVL